MKLRGLKLGAILFFFFFFLSAAYSLSPIVQIDEFHYRKKGFDRNQDGKTDFWIYTSYRHRWIKKEFDNNFDGKIDAVIERIRIKNVTRYVTYSFTKEIPIGVTYEFPERRYLFTDEDQDGYFDKFNNNGSELSIHEDASYSINFLVNVLENFKSQEERTYVLEKINEKYTELENLLKTLLENSGDKEAWERAMEKTKMYLDLPSSGTLPIVLHLAKDKEEMEGNVAYIDGYNHLIFYPQSFDNVTLWLETIDHEVLHIIHNRMGYEEAREEGEPTWKEYVEKRHTHTPTVEPIGLSGATLYCELAAYLHEFERSDYYKPFEDPQFSYERLIDAFAHVALIDEYTVTPDEGDPVSYHFLKVHALSDMLDFFWKHPHFRETLGRDVEASKEDFESHYQGK